jgi:hypothetical protein
VDSESLAPKPGPDEPRAPAGGGFGSLSPLPVDGPAGPGRRVGR